MDAVAVFRQNEGAVPLAYDIDTALGIVTITGEYAAAADWTALLTRVGADPRYRRGFSFLRDLRASTHPVDADTVIGIIAVVRAAWEPLGVHRAAIVTRPGLDPPATVAHALAEDERLPLRAFSSLTEAMDWLGERAGPR